MEITTVNIPSKLTLFSHLLVLIEKCATTPINTSSEIRALIEEYADKCNDAFDLIQNALSQKSEGMIAAEKLKKFLMKVDEVVRMVNSDLRRHKAQLLVQEYHLYNQLIVVDIPAILKNN